MIHPTQRYTDMQGWIPETDIDGVDAKKSFFADIKNADLENGFIRGCIAPTEEQLSELVRALVFDEEWDLLSVKHFYHFTQGNIFAYILWKDNTVKVMVEELDNDVIVDVPIDKVNDNVLLTEKPTRLSFSYVDNQFKANLNIESTYAGLSTAQDVVLNLNLTYLEERKYSDDVKFVEGWYCSPRWLGWNFVNTGLKESVYFLNDDVEGFYVLDSTDADITLNNADFSVSEVLTVATTGEGYLEYDNLSNIGRLVFESSTASSGTVKIEIWNKDSVLLYSNLLEYSSAIIENEDLAINLVGAPLKLKITISENIQVQNIVFWNLQYRSDVQVQTDTPDWASKVIVLAKYVDGQRALAYSPAIALSDELGIKNTLYLYVDKADIDWRISAYEFYANLQSPNLHMLIGTVEVDSGWTDTGGGEMKKLVELSNSSTTLNFNYGLGSKVPIGLKATGQHLIYDEAHFKGRQYFVNDSDKVYQSHLSGTGRLQSDSFPTNTDVEFGFFRTSKSEINLALAVTNLEELLIIGAKRAYTYYIEGNAGTVFRTLKYNNGGRSITSKPSLVKGLDGNPESTILLWTNRYGIFIYGGGLNPPQDISFQTHRNFWKSLINRDTAVAFFNKAKTEFWIAVGDIILIYEFPYNKFRKYELGFTIKSYIGTVDDVLYVLSTDNRIRKINPYSTSSLSCTIESHYSTNTIVVGEYPIDAPEYETKILQEIYIAVKDMTPGLVQMTIIADGNEYDPITFVTNFFTDLLPSPLLIRYGKIKIRLTVPPGVNLREFGYSFSVPGQAPYQQVKEAIEGIGMSSGKKAGVGL